MTLRSPLLVLAATVLSCCLALTGGRSAVAVAAAAVSTSRAGMSPQAPSRDQGWWLGPQGTVVARAISEVALHPKRLRSASGPRSICATSDGGKHWRVAFRAPTSTDQSDDVSG